jgi:monovalent cation:H+ antiporter-2, CPA2 family
MNETASLSAMAPAIALLGLGVLSTILSRSLNLSPIVGYIALGLVLRAACALVWLGASVIDLLAQLGVALMLFDIGLHFSLKHLRDHASDIFAFGPVQVLASTLLIGLGGLLFGLKVPAAFLLGAVFALSSTAVVGRLIAERHQQGCPVALTATSILVFQDIAAILLLIVATAAGDHGSPGRASVLAIVKAILAFGVTVLLSPLIVGRVLGLVAKSGNDEIFTAVALFFALAAGWITGSIGLSLTLGAFLGGQALSGSAYRAVIEYEIKPFRGLLLGFFFIPIGLVPRPGSSSSLLDDDRHSNDGDDRFEDPRKRRRRADLPLVCTRLNSTWFPSGPGIRICVCHVGFAHSSSSNWHSERVDRYCRGCSLDRADTYPCRCGTNACRPHARPGQAA